jgi:2-polyprenyl-6-methoxyphenol hydroxylase-like FAD-dependent oxidoreductase
LAEDCSAGARAVTLADGRVVEGDLFFGCDGAQSRVRGMAFPQARLGETVVKEIVSVAHAPALARSLGTAFHKFHDEEGGLAVGMLAEGDERVVWFVQFDARRWTGVAATSESLRAFAAERTQGWAPEVAVALSGTNFQRSHLWATRDLEPLAALARGNIALVGDAAHACLPFTSQGANGALVDAAVLRRVLADVRGRSGVASAFALYSGLRRPHHRRMFMEGRRLQAAFLAPLAGTTPVVPLAQVEPSAVRVNR